VNLHIFGQWCSTHTVIQNPKTKAWIVGEGNDLLLHQVNAQVVHLFLEHYRATAKPRKAGATEISTYTTTNMVRTIKAFLNWCACDPEYGNQVHYVTVQRIETPSTDEVIIQPFTDEQIRDLFEACDKEADEHLQLRSKAILAVMLDTGIRAHELVTLKIGNVSLDAKDAYIRVLGKGRKWGEVGLGEQSRRLIQKYLRQFRIPTLESEMQQKHKHLAPKQLKKVSDQAIAHEVVFMNRAARPLTVGGLEQLFYRLGRVAHIEGVRCSPHTMRHSFAVRFWRRTHDIRTLSKLLRHSSIITTENYLKSILQSEARLGAPSILDEL
jgi:integrase/recombinase XerD